MIRKTVVRQVLMLIPDEPDVIPVIDISSQGIPLQDAEILAANHSGGMVPNTQVQGEASSDRYAGGVFEVNPDLAQIEGVYVPDLLVYLAGKAGVPVSVGEDANESIVALKEKLRVWATS